MLRALQNLFHRPAFRFGLARDTRSRLRDPQFVSFMAQNNQHHSTNSDLQDAVMRGRRLAKQAFVVLLVAGGAWVVIESAKALSVF